MATAIAKAMRRMNLSRIIPPSPLLTPRPAAKPDHCTKSVRAIYILPSSFRPFRENRSNDAQDLQPCDRHHFCHGLAGFCAPLLLDVRSGKGRHLERHGEGIGMDQPA